MAASNNANDNSSCRLQLRHIHEHGLVLQDLSEYCSTFWCSICRYSVIGDPAYHCPDCNDFFIHEYCAELPSAIQQHPFHPQHQLELRKGEVIWHSCGCSAENHDQYHYRCDECRIALHVGCAVATATHLTHTKEHDQEDKPEEVKTIQHIAHQHPLESFCLDNSPWKPYCLACKKRISGGAYGCHACIFLLHESCALLPQETNNHPLHPKHSLTLVLEQPYSFGFPYFYNECHFHVDIIAVVNVEHHHISIPQDDHNNEKDRQEIQQFSHPHPMTYCYMKGYTSLDCDFCNKEIAGDFYVCGDCFFKIHKSCTESPQDMVHPLHPHHHLILQTNSAGCVPCWRDYKILYKCQVCDFGLHPNCAFQSLSASEEELVINIQHIHEHPLRLHATIASKCTVGEEDADDLVYACDECHIFSIHRSCAEAARKSQHSIHPKHPLILLSPT